MSLHPIEELAQWQQPGGLFVNERGESVPRPPVSLDGDMYGEMTIDMRDLSEDELRLGDIQAEIAAIASRHVLSTEDHRKLEELEVERLLTETDIAFKAERMAHPDAAAALEIWLESQLEEFVRAHPGATLDERMQAEISLLSEYIGSHVSRQHPDASTETLIRVARALHDELLTLYNEMKADLQEDEVYEDSVNEHPKIAA